MERLYPYMAEDLDRILEMAAAVGGEVLFSGDGASVFHKKITGYCGRFRIAAGHSRLQRAASVGLLALNGAYAAVSHEANPLIYLRKPEAERTREEADGRR